MAIEIKSPTAQKIRIVGDKTSSTAKKTSSDGE